MKFFKAVLGYFLAGIVIVVFWSKIVDIFGIVGGWVSALVLIGPLWYINHYKSLILHDDEEVFIDMGLAIATTTVVISILKVKKNMIFSIYESFPTLFFLAIGAILGVIFSIFLENKIKNK